LGFGWFVSVDFAVYLIHCLQNDRNGEFVAVGLIDRHFYDDVGNVKSQVFKLALPFLVTDLELTLVKNLHDNLLLSQISKRVGHVLLLCKFTLSHIAENFVDLENLVDVALLFGAPVQHFVVIASEFELLAALLQAHYCHVGQKLQVLRRLYHFISDLISST